MNIKTRTAHAFRSALTLISPALNAKVAQYVKTGRWLDLDHPVTFSDKLVALKIRDYNHNPLVWQCADKYAVRQYVRDCGYGDTLNELIAVYDTVDVIEWEKLPDQFAMKWNFGCGMNIICRDKSALDIPAAAERMRKWSRSRYYLRYAELQYRDIEKKILVERYLSSRSGPLPPDFKLYCFHGKCAAILYISDRSVTPHRAAFFDPDWSYLGLPVKSGGRRVYKPFDPLPPRPASLTHMLEAAEALSKPFPFVRVDFYDIDGRAVFGEMTFTPAGGHDVSEVELRGTSMAALL